MSAPSSPLDAPGPESPGAVPVLYHYTCRHFEESIRAVGAVVPRRHPGFPTLEPVAWFTTDRWPDADRCGLTYSTLACDRTAFRFKVTESAGLWPWTSLREHMILRWEPGFDPIALEAFEHFGAPATWWVSTWPVPVVPL